GHLGAGIGRGRRGAGDGPVRHPLDHPAALGSDHAAGDRLLLHGAGTRPPGWTPPGADVADTGALGARDPGDRDPRQPAHRLLDRAITDRDALIAHLAEMFAADTVRVEVLDIDLVRDTTLVDVRYKTLPRRRSNAAEDARPGSRTSADHAAGILDTEVR